MVRIRSLKLDQPLELSLYKEGLPDPVTHEASMICLTGNGMLTEEAEKYSAYDGQRVVIAVMLIIAVANWRAYAKRPAICNEAGNPMAAYVKSPRASKPVQKGILAIPMTSSGAGRVFRQGREVLCQGLLASVT